MPKFDRRLLLGAVEQVLAAAPKAHEERQAKRLQEWQDRADAWVAQHREEWGTALTAIRAKLRRGEPVAIGDLPGTSAYSRSPSIFSDAKPQASEYVPDRDLTVLREVLVSLADDFVTASALRDLGVSAHALRAAVSKLGNK